MWPCAALWNSASQCDVFGLLAAAWKHLGNLSRQLCRMMGAKCQPVSSIRICTLLLFLITPTNITHCLLCTLAGAEPIIMSNYELCCQSAAFLPGCAGQPMLGLKYSRGERMKEWWSAINCLLCQGASEEPRWGQEVVIYFTHPPWNR